jgi:hypothetical protein
MNVNLHTFKEKSKFSLGWNYIKKFKHNNDEFKGWRLEKKPMVSEKAKGGAKGVKAFTTQAYSLACLGLNFHEDNGVPSQKKGIGPF